MTSVVVPWRDTGDPRRASALAWVVGWWGRAHPGWDVVVGSCPDGGWVKAAAVADGLRRCGPGPVVVADADVWCDGVGDAVAAVESGVVSWAVPHGDVCRLDVAGSDAVLEGGAPDLGALDGPRYRGMAGGGMVVLGAGVWGRCPLDPRFVGWGQEDEAWGLALHGLCGVPWRGGAVLWHLWHEPQPRMSRRVGSAAGAELAARYLRAAVSPRMMVELVSEIEGVVVSDGDMWVYRNLNELSQVVESPTEIVRLSRLPNWEILERPWWAAHVESVTVPEVAPVAVAGPVVEVGPTAEDMAAAEALEEPVRATAVVGVVSGEGDVTVDALGPVRPSPRESKQVWEEFARSIGVDPDGMTKAELLRACRP